MTCSRGGCHFLNSSSTHMLIKVEIEIENSRNVCDWREHVETVQTDYEMRWYRLIDAAMWFIAVYRGKWHFIDFPWHRLRNDFINKFSIYRVVNAWTYSFTEANRSRFEFPPDTIPMTMCWHRYKNRSKHSFPHFVAKSFPVMLLLSSLPLRQPTHVFFCFAFFFFAHVVCVDTTLLYFDSTQSLRARNMCFLLAFFYAHSLARSFAFSIYGHQAYFRSTHHANLGASRANSP